MSYTDSPLVSFTRLSPNNSGKRKHTIDTVTVHCTATPVSVERLGEIFANPSRRASSNYGVGPDGRVGLYVHESDRSWCSSSASNDNRAITIEVSSEAVAPFAVTDAAYNSLILLLADICRRNEIPQLLWKGEKSLIGKVDQQNMTVHRWFANKSCPGDYLYTRHAQIAAEVNKLLKTEDDNVTQEQFNGMMAVWLDQQKSKPAQPYAADALAWAKSTGIMAGDNSGNQMPRSFAEREDIAVMLQRLDSKIQDDMSRRIASLSVVETPEE